MKEKKLRPNEVEWVVNELAELGVKIGKQFFWLYKGDSLVYGPTAEREMKWRKVEKREFGETCRPVNLDPVPEPYVAGEGWKTMR